MKKITKLLLTIALALSSLFMANAVFADELISSKTINQGAYKRLLSVASQYDVENLQISDSTPTALTWENYPFYLGVWNFAGEGEADDYAIVATVKDTAVAGTYTYTFTCNSINYSGSITVTDPSSYNILGEAATPTELFNSDYYEYDLGKTYEIDYQTIKINKSDDAISNYYNNEGYSDAKFLLGAEDNSYFIYVGKLVEPGVYCVSYKDQDKNSYSGYVKVLSNYVTYGGNKVMVGLGNNSQGGAIHVSSSGGSQVDQINPGFGMLVCATYVDENGNSTGVVEQFFMNLIKNVSFSYDANKIEVSPNDPPTEIYKDINGDDVGLLSYSGKYKGSFATPENQSIIGTVSIDLDNDGTVDTEVKCKYNVSTIILNTYSINMYDNANTIVNNISGSSALEKINTALANKTSLQSLLTSLNGDNEVDVGDGNYINRLFIYLDNTEYNGVITSNINEQTNVEIFILSKGYSYDYSAGYDGDVIKTYKETDNTASPVANTKKRTIINGGLVNNGTIHGVQGIDFVATNNTKVGILANGVYGEEQPCLADFNYIFECSFTGYDYGIKAVGNCLVSGIQYCKFENNKTGLYIDSIGHCFYSDTLYNTFINNDIAIDIESLSDYIVPYEFTLRENYFFNTKNNYVDYKLSGDESLQGTFFFNGCYFAKDYTSANRYLNSNVRSSKVVVVNKNITKAVTSPCIKYPENLGTTDPILGFDVGGTGTNALKNGTGYSMSFSGLTKNTDLEIEICSNEGEEEGRIIIGGNN